jgi:phosphatidylglycerol---prolipoprotein diacylglyceryl transferase
MLARSLSSSIYFIFISLILTVSVLWINQRSRKLQYSGATAMDLFFVVTLSGALGARLLHVFFEEPQYYYENPLRFFLVLQGGFVYYGGLIFGFCAAWLFLRWKKQAFSQWLDFFTPVISLSYAFGRIACFLTGCCYGKFCNLPWAVEARHPTQLYAVVLELLVFSGLMKLEKNPWVKAVPGRLFALWLTLHSINRFVIELFRGDPRGPSLGMYSLSMLLSIVFFILSLAYLKLSHSETKA